jgi:predicted aspartyl protease
VAAFVRSLGVAFFLFLPLAAAPNRATAAGDPCGERPETEVAVTLLHAVPLVTARINRAAVTMVLDTGAAETVVTTDTAARLGLSSHYEYPRNLRSVSGGVVTGEARVGRFAVGAAVAADFIVLVGSLALPNPERVQPAGLLGGDFLSHFDVDLDLYDGRLALYRHSCTPPRPPWRDAYTMIRANRSIDDRLFFPVDLDGHELFAFIDTGAQVSAIDRAAVRALGLSNAAIARGPTATMRGISAQRILTHAHRFGWLRVGDQTWRDPVMVVADLNLPDADIVLGVDFLRGRRVWFSYAAHRIFLGPPRAQ